MGQVKEMQRNNDFICTHTHTNTLSHRKIIINSTGIPKASLNL